MAFSESLRNFLNGLVKIKCSCPEELLGLFETLSKGGEQKKIFIKDQICSQFSNNYIN